MSLSVLCLKYKRYFYSFLSIVILKYLFIFKFSTFYFISKMGEKMARPKGTGGRARELSKNEIKRISLFMGETRYALRNRAIFYLCLTCGLRINEATNLSIVTIAPHGKLEDSFVLEKHSTKGKRSRTIPLVHPKVRKHLEEYLAERFGDDSWNPELPLFPSQKNPREPLQANSWIRAFSSVCKSAELSDVSTHSMRRTFANQLRRKGVDIYLISKLLGHSSIAMTQRYFEAGDVEFADAVKGLDI